MKRIAAPQAPKAVRASQVKTAHDAARARGKGKTRTPAEVDAALDLILARLEDLDD